VVLSKKDIKCLHGVDGILCVKRQACMIINKPWIRTASFNCILQLHLVLDVLLLDMPPVLPCESDSIGLKEEPP